MGGFNIIKRLRSAIPKILYRFFVVVLLFNFTVSVSLASVGNLELPSNGNVVSGEASVNVDGAAMEIHQSTDKVILEWDTFNVGSDASVNFSQPSVSSVALNRVLSSDPSKIFGSLTSVSYTHLTLQTSDLV